MNTALLLAAGQSKRFKSDKLFAELDQKPVFLHALQFLHDSPKVSSIVIAANRRNFKKIKALINGGNFEKVKAVVLGGKTRFESVKKCLAAVFPERKSALRGRGPDFLIIHNAANPLATQGELHRCIALLKKKKNISGVAVGRELHATLRYAPKGAVVRLVAREDVWELETPQVVRARDFLECVKKTRMQNFTDDLQVLEEAGLTTRIIFAHQENRKITTKEDLETARLFVERNYEGKMYSVGIGEDSHKWREQGVGDGPPARRVRTPGGEQWWESNRTDRGKYLVLGGVKVENFPALEADSDGDVMLHALCNAIASSIGKGSLGTYATAMYRRGIHDSREYLKKIMNELPRHHFRLKHCAFSIEASQPIIDPLVPKIKKSLSVLLDLPESSIGITATSGIKKDRLIKCKAMVLVAKKSSNT